jgi:hypothetical protein
MTDPTPDFRALCAELNSLLVYVVSTHPDLSEDAVRLVNDVCDCARAALATQPPEPPTQVDFKYQCFIEDYR